MKDLLYKIVFSIFGLCAAMFSYAQGQSVTGMITDGEKPLADITVVVKGNSGNHTVTDQNGNYTIILKKSDHVLVLSGVGFLKQEVSTDTSFNFIMQPDPKSKGLDDVVVIGYGQTKKITLTGAVSSISGAVLRQSPSASLQNALSGRLPGLFSEQRSGQPGNDAASIQIRGVSTLNTSAGSSNPLILVDDIEFSYTQLQQIDPNEVESLSILKDASTTSVYGVRGANGVIIVKTRRGLAGRPELSVRNEYGLQFATRMPQTNDGYTTLQLLKESLLEKGTDPAVAYPAFFSGNNLDYYKNNSDPYGHPNLNWWNVLMRNNSSQDRVNFDISGGSRLIRYFISLGYITQGGIYNDFTKGQGYNGNFFYNRYNFRSNIDIDPTSTLKIRMDVSGRFGISNSPNEKSIVNGSTTFQRLWDGTINNFDYPVFNQNGSLGGMPGILQQLYGSNPVGVETYGGYNRTFNNNFNIVTSADQKLNFITSGLSAKLLLSFASDYNYEKDLQRSQIPLFYLDPITKIYTPAITNLYRLPPLTRSSYPLGSGQMLNIQASLNYAKSFGMHNISGLVLLNQNSNTTNTYSSSVITPGIPTNYRGVTGRISYNYAAKYMLDLNAGYNGSDRFGNGKKYGLFPAISAGWNIAAEPFFKNNITFISLFKIRGSYGLTGSDNISGFQYLYQQVYNSGQKGYNFGSVSTPVSGISEGALGNENVTWEKDRKTDIGADIQMFNGNLSITADYFHDYRYDILLTRGSVPAVFGVGLPAVNMGKVSNGGYEVEVKYNGSAGNLKYWIDGQVSYAKNKVLFRDEPSKLYPWLAQTGHSIGAIFGYTWTGQYFNSISDIYGSALETTAVPLKNVFPGGLKLADLNGDHILDQNDQGYLGTNNPRYTAGLSLGVSYKGIDLSVLFQGAFDYILSMQRGLIAYARGYNVSVPFNLGRWTPETADRATYPSLAGSITDGETSSYWYRSGNYVRFKNFELGYTLPKNTANRLHLKNVRLYANGYNLGLIYVALPVQIDPESVASTSVGEYPQQRIINFGIQIGL